MAQQQLSSQNSHDRYFIAGGAGFIGSHFIDELLGPRNVAGVTIYDNFSSGRPWHYQHHLGDSRFRVVTGEIADSRKLAGAMDGHDVVIHLASNPDIARAAVEPAIDFIEGTMLTHQIVEAMRVTSAKRILYAAGSGVYGDIGETEADENYSPLHPVSTYGASKLSGEASICAYAHMFGLSGCAFRFGNVVGSSQTHGVGFDFVRRLQNDPKSLRILGDGRQSKSYVHVSDVVAAVLLANSMSQEPFAVFNVATGDYITVKEIADLAVDCVGLRPGSTAYEFTGGARGWQGDVPVVRLNIDKIRGLGWQPRMNTRQALQAAILDLHNDPRIAA
jgi:UDP-glucose 4-epimerase